MSVAEKPAPTASLESGAVYVHDSGEDSGIIADEARQHGKLAAAPNNKMSAWLSSAGMRGACSKQSGPNYGLFLLQAMIAVNTCMSCRISEIPLHTQHGCCKTSMPYPTD